MKRLKQILVAGLVLLLVAGLCFAWLEYKRSQAIKQVAALGYPVTAEAMLQHYAPVPEEENAWVLLEGLDEQIQYLPEGEDTHLPIIGASEWCHEYGDMPIEVQLATEKFLRLNVGVLTTLHEAVRRPYLHIPGKLTEVGQISGDAAFGEMAMLRNSTRMFVLEGTNALKGQDYGRASGTFLAAMHIARFLDQPNTGAMGLLVQSAVMQMAVMGLLPPLMEAHGVDDAFWAEFAGALQTQEQMLAVEKYVGWELAWLNLQTYEVGTPLWRLFADFFGNFFEVLLFPETLPDKMLEQLKYLYDFLWLERYHAPLVHAALLQELHDNPQYKHCNMQTALDQAEARYSYIAFFPTSWGKAYFLSGFIAVHTRDLAQIRFWQIAVALERHHLKHGAYPASLADLDADFMPTLPEAPIEDVEWVYTLEEGGGCRLFYDTSAAMPRRDSIEIVLARP